MARDPKHDKYFASATARRQLSSTRRYGMRIAWRGNSTVLIPRTRFRGFANAHCGAARRCPNWAIHDPASKQSKIGSLSQRYR